MLPLLAVGQDCCAGSKAGSVAGERSRGLLMCFSAASVRLGRRKGAGEGGWEIDLTSPL